MDFLYMIVSPEEAVMNVEWKLFQKSVGRMLSVISIYCNCGNFFQDIRRLFPTICSTQRAAAFLPQFLVFNSYPGQTVKCHLQWKQIKWTELMNIVDSIPVAMKII